MRAVVEIAVGEAAPDRDDLVGLAGVGVDDVLKRRCHGARDLAVGDRAVGVVHLSSPAGCRLPQVAVVCATRRMPVNRRRMIAGAGALALALAVPPIAAQQVAAPDAVVLITLDGARTEEIFAGLDVDVLKTTL